MGERLLTYSVLTVEFARHVGHPDRVPPLEGAGVAADGEGVGATGAGGRHQPWGDGGHHFQSLPLGPGGADRNFSDNMVLIIDIRNLNATT